MKKEKVSKKSKAAPKEAANGVSADRLAQYTSKVTMDQVWGKNFSKFKPDEPEAYEARLKKETRFDLQQECIKIGLIPHDSRDIMIQRLVKECKKDYNQRASYSVRPKQVVVKSAAAQAILNKAASL
jgi:hypothetical protein